MLFVFPLSWGILKQLEIHSPHQETERYVTFETLPGESYHARCSALQALYFSLYILGLLHKITCFPPTRPQRKIESLCSEQVPWTQEFRKDFELDIKKIFSRGGRMKQWIFIVAVFTRIV